MAAESDYETLQNAHQQSINDFYSCFLGSQTANRLQKFTKKFLAVFIGNTGYGTLSTKC